MNSSMWKYTLLPDGQKEREGVREGYESGGD